MTFLEKKVKMCKQKRVFQLWFFVYGLFLGLCFVIHIDPIQVRVLVHTNVNRLMKFFRSFYNEK